MQAKLPLDKKALDQIQSGAISEKGVDGLASSLHITTRHLLRIIKAKTGYTPTQLNQARRLHEAQLLVQKTNIPITKVAFSCEFTSLRQFNDVFKQMFKTTPREMRKNSSIKP